MRIREGAEDGVVQGMRTNPCYYENPLGVVHRGHAASCEGRRRDLVARKAAVRLQRVHAHHKDILGAGWVTPVVLEDCPCQDDADAVVDPQPQGEGQKDGVVEAGSRMAAVQGGAAGASPPFWRAPLDCALAAAHSWARAVAGEAGMTLAARG